MRFIGSLLPGGVLCDTKKSFTKLALIYAKFVDVSGIFRLSMLIHARSQPEDKGLSSSTSQSRDAEETKTGKEGAAASTKLSLILIWFCRNTEHAIYI